MISVKPSVQCSIPYPHPKRQYDALSGKHGVSLSWSASLNPFPSRQALRNDSDGLNWSKSRFQAAARTGKSGRVGTRTSGGKRSGRVATKPAQQPPSARRARRPIRVPLPSSGPLNPPEWAQQAIEQQPWRGGLEPCGEHDYTLSPSNPAHITGRIPEALQGTLYRCGPGRIRVGGTKFGHWFDGDGMVYALHLDGPNGTARFVCKWVRTSALEQRGGPELEAGEGKGEDTGIRVKGAWTQATAGGLLKNVGLPANPVNTSIIHFAGKLLALCEGGPPFLLDAQSLSTVGPYSFPNLALPFFSAHPKLDPATGELYNFGSVLFGMQPFAIAADGQHTRMGALQGSPEVALVHDCAMSSRFLVFTIPPYAASAGDVAQMLAGKQSLGNRFTYDESKPTRVVVVGKESLSVEVQMDVWPPFSNYHFCNAYEDGNKLHVLLTVLDGPRDGLEGVFKDMYGESWQRNNQCSVWELVIDTNTWDLLSRRRAMHSEPGTRGPVLGMEFAVVNPAFTSRKSRYLYVLGSMPERDREELWSNGGLGDGVWYGGAGVKGEEDGEGEEEGEGEEGEEGREEEGGEEEGKKMAEYGYLNCIQKYDLKTKQVTTHVTPPGCYVNECSFIPNSGTDNEDASKEDEGYLAAFVYDAARHRSHVVVLDARDVAAAPVAVVHLQSHVPFHFHGTWAGKATML